ncbi:alpha/beta hydrolase [Microbacterium aoyamense]|uniref:Alpha/beta hydrolase n=1 Tax=Microbacterium aoyamense TaxID=344166 RepID=A0ABN2PD16_9MICO|nr:alpha/beta hydrolase [Microbacterium aoyamense]
MTPLGPPIAAELRPFLPEIAAERPFMDGPEGVGKLRAAMAEFEESVDAVAAETGAHIAELRVDGVPVIVITPADLEGRVGAVLNVHGGGLVAGSHRSVLGANARTAIELECVMVLPDYRLAPEHPYPAGLDDVETVWEWLRTGGAGRGVDVDRIVVMGGSAGGCLSAGLLVRLTGKGGQLPRALVLVQPQLDDRNVHPSTFELEHAYFWDRPSNLYSWSVYLAGTDIVPAEAAPARAHDLSGFPPTFIEIGQVDIFRDEGLEFAARLSHAGVPVEAHMWAGAFHGFDGLIEASVSRRAVAARREFLRDQLNARG